MKKHSKILVLFLAISFVFILAALAQAQTDEKVTCPVSGKEIKKSEAKGSHEYNGKTYYFCCPNCKEKFVKDSEKYTQQKSHEGHEHAAHEAQEEHMYGEHKENDTAIDPICGRKVKKTEAKATYEHNGKTYYFCMEGCKEKFMKEPEKHVKADNDTVTCPVSGDNFNKSDAADSMEYEGKTYYLCCSECKEKFTKDPGKYAKKKGLEASHEDGNGDAEKASCGSDKECSCSDMKKQKEKSKKK